MSSDESSTTSSQSVSTEDAAGSKEQPPKNNSVTRDGAVALATEGASKAFGWDRMNQKKATKKSNKKSSSAAGNELSHLIPGYTAPMRLEAKSLKGITGASLAQLRNRAARGDSATYSPSISILNKKQESSFDPAVASKKVKTPSS